MLRIHRSPRYWLGSILLIAAGAWLGELLAERQAWIDLRYRAHEFFGHSARPMRQRYTALVLIEDDEYWGRDLARRVPIKRRYLAQLVDLLDRADAAVIALDFDFRSPRPDGTLRDFRDYADETKDFLATVDRVATARPVVLPRTLGYDRGYTTESDIYEDHPFQGRVLRGYIALPNDMRQVPFPLALVGTSCQSGRCKEGSCFNHRCYLDSFAVAIVRATNDDRALSVMSKRNNTLPFGTFIKDLPAYSAGDVVNRWNLEKVKRELGHKIVLVGAGWSRFAYGRGGPVDTYLSPIGMVGGVFLHANYVEAIKDSRIEPPVRRRTAILIEVAFAILVAVLFGLEVSLYVKALGVIGFCLLTIGLAYFSWQNLGLFFDFFIPVVLLLVKGVFEMRQDLKAQRREIRSLRSQIGEQARPSQAAGGT